MAEVKVLYDREGHTLTVWFTDSSQEYICEETGEEVVLMKDAAGRVIGFVCPIAGAAAQRDSSGPPTDRISALSRQIDAGDVRLTFDPDNGYLRSLLTALRVPLESQVVVFSQTSMQFDLISPRNPRAV